MSHALGGWSVTSGLMLVLGGLGAQGHRKSFRTLDDNIFVSPAEETS